MRVPVRVEYYASVGAGEVDPQAAGSGGEEEDEVPVVVVVAGAVGAVGLLGVEGVHLALALVDLGAAVDAAVLPGAPDEVVLDDGEDLGHLGEDKDLVLLLVELREHPVEEVELSAVHGERTRSGATS